MHILKPSQAVQRLLDVSGVRGVLVEIEEIPGRRAGRPAGWDSPDARA